MLTYQQLISAHSNGCLNACYSDTVLLINGGRTFTQYIPHERTQIRLFSPQQTLRVQALLYFENNNAAGKVSTKIVIILVCNIITSNLKRAAWLSPTAEQPPHCKSVWRNLSLLQVAPIGRTPACNGNFRTSSAGKRTL